MLSSSRSLFPASRRSVGAILGLTAFAVFLLPNAVHAQSLDLYYPNDNVTVSAAGTHGIYQFQPINNTTSTYTNVPKPGYLTYAVITQDNTMFTLGSGGSLTADGSGVGLFEYGGSVVINGGTVSGGQSAVQTQGGTLAINGGTFSARDALLTSEGSTTQINGGNFSSLDDGLAVFGGNVTVDGGTFSGGFSSFVAAGGGVLDLFGTFNGYSTGDTIMSGSGTITGTLLDGEAINDTYFVNNDTPGTKIEFNVGSPAAVPEASTTVSFGLLLALGISGLVVAARRRKVAGTV